EQAPHENGDHEVWCLQSSLRVGDRARLDREELKVPLSVGWDAAEAAEAGRDGRLARVLRVRIPAARIGLPDLHEGVGHRQTIAVEHTPPDLEMLTRATGWRYTVDGEPRETDMQVRANRL